MLTDAGSRLNRGERWSKMRVLTAEDPHKFTGVASGLTAMRGLNVLGLYPCGEGAGYAGGIISAALDGIRCIEAVTLKNVTD